MTWRQYLQIPPLHTTDAPRGVSPGQLGAEYQLVVRHVVCTSSVDTERHILPTVCIFYAIVPEWGRYIGIYIYIHIRGNITDRWITGIELTPWYPGSTGLRSSWRGRGRERENEEPKTCVGCSCANLRRLVLCRHHPEKQRGNDFNYIGISQTLRRR